MMTKPTIPFDGYIVEGLMIGAALLLLLVAITLGGYLIYSWS
jgi:hypothetical protein